tara:strand:- start:449 stop:1189 length:741 start_codon:yes stop_codon:yes gene_type:complete
LGETRAYHAAEHGIISEGKRIDPWSGEELKAEHLGYQVPGWSELFVEYDCIKEKAIDQGCPLIFMHRDVRDVVASMKSTIPRFLSGEIRPNIKTWMADPSRSFKKKFGKIVERSDYNEVVLGTVFWMYRTGAYFDIDCSLDNYCHHAVHYNDLCRNPREQVGGVMKFLNVPWHDSLLKHHQVNHYESDPKTKMTMGNTRVDRPVDVDSVDRWKTCLTEGEIDQIMKIAGPLNDRVHAVFENKIHPL